MCESDTNADVRPIVTVKSAPFVDDLVHSAIAMGVRDFRVNFGRKNIDVNLALAARIVQLGREQHRTLSVWADLPGPKNRIRDVGGEKLLQLRVSASFTLLASQSQSKGSTKGLVITVARAPVGVHVGDPIYLCGRRVRAVVEDRKRDRLMCKVIQGGEVHIGGDVVCPRSFEPYEQLSLADREIASSVADVVDYVCPSFTDSPAIIDEVRQVMGRDAVVVAKLETPMALQRAAEISAKADGLMLCRGDLQTYYSLDEIASAAVRVRELSGRHSTPAIFASSFFFSLRRSSTLSGSDRKYLQHALGCRPDYILIDETTERDWARILACVRSECPALGLRPLLNVTSSASRSPSTV